LIRYRRAGEQAGRCLLSIGYEQRDRLAPAAPVEMRRLIY
jgi:hypothetical protein